MTDETQTLCHLERNNHALFDACRDGFDEICEVLMGFGVIGNSTVVDNKTPHPACVDLLLIHGACANFGQFERLSNSTDGNRC